MKDLRDLKDLTTFPALSGLRAAERERNTSQDLSDYRLRDGSRHGRNLAVTVLSVMQ